MTSLLGNEWHLSSTGNDILTENSSIKDKEQIYNVALNTDLKEICKPVLQEFTNETPKIILQIHKIRNISAPKANEESQVAPRLLKLTLTDGVTYIQAFELTQIGGISLKNTSPGTKILLENAKITSGYLLLTPQSCKILGGKVAHLYEKWEITKSVKKNRTNILHDEDGPPPWVNFGTKIKISIQESNFKSLVEKTKESKESSEFDQQRQDAIAEASSGAIRKVFSGKVKQTVQVQSTNKKIPENTREKKEIGKFRGKTLVREKDMDENPEKPLEKLSLFAFVEDKLPVRSNQEHFYNNNFIKNTFKETDSYIEDRNKYDYKRKKTLIPKEFEKPNNNQEKNTINPKRENSYSTPNSNVLTDTVEKKSNNLPYIKNHSNSNDQNSNFSMCEQYKQKPNYGTQRNNSYPQNYSQSNYENPNVIKNYSHKQKLYPRQNNPHPQQDNIYHQQNNPQLGSVYSQQNSSHFQQDTPISYSHQNNHNSQQGKAYSQNHSQPQQDYSFQKKHQNTSYAVQKMTDTNQNSNTYNKHPHQKQNFQNDVNHVTQQVQNMALNSQFASRSLRQHLNLPDERRNKNDQMKSKEIFGGGMNIGDEIMAKYWEDGKYYNAKIISVTDKTFAVMFRDYGNIEEILKSDCHPMLPSNNRHNQQSTGNTRQYSGTLEYRRKHYK